MRPLLLIACFFLSTVHAQTPKAARKITVQKSTAKSISNSFKIKGHIKGMPANNIAFLNPRGNTDVIIASAYCKADVFILEGHLDSSAAYQITFSRIADLIYIDMGNETINIIGKLKDETITVNESQYKELGESLSDMVIKDGDIYIKSNPSDKAYTYAGEMVVKDGKRYLKTDGPVVKHSQSIQIISKTRVPSTQRDLEISWAG